MAEAVQWQGISLIDLEAWLGRTAHARRAIILLRTCKATIWHRAGIADVLQAQGILKIEKSLDPMVREPTTNA
jgi:hypothetical protein